MKKFTDYLDEMKKLTGSDYKTAQVLGYDRSAISQMRSTGKISEETAIKIAKVLDEPEEELLLASMIEKSKGEIKATWEKIARAAHYMSVVFVAFQAIRSYETILGAVHCILC